ncbi:PadR family transcriptional regulator [Brevibacillus ginsengisoli]|uniref:PadR family transcriptional regulator n=1 Tax=Brevibacillus ginsengisoli TaxID=363854 RepID=UPI003CED55B3
MLEPAILGFLMESSIHGYELKQRLTLLNGHFRSISDGALYPAINRLEKQGLLSKQKEVNDSGMTRQVMTITQAGKEKLLELLQHPSDMDISDRNRFFTMLAFLKYLSADEQKAILMRRLTFLEGGRSFFSNGDKPVRFTEEKDVFRAGMLHIAKETSRVEKEWLNSMIASLQ